MPEAATDIGAALFVAFLIVQRLGELVLATRNTRRALARGAVEIAPGHYPLIVALHTAWIVAIAVLGLANPVLWRWLLAFALLQILRVWIIATLGERWTTRIIVENRPLVTGGPFRYFKHPNYLLVIVEIFVAPMVLGLIWVAIVFSVLNAAVLFIRIRAEEAALSPLRSN